MNQVLSVKQEKTAVFVLSLNCDDRQWPELLAEGVGCGVGEHLGCEPTDSVSFSQDNYELQLNFNGGFWKVKQLELFLLPFHPQAAFTASLAHCDRCMD